MPERVQTVTSELKRTPAGEYARAGSANRLPLKARLAAIALTAPGMAVLLAACGGGDNGVVAEFVTQTPASIVQAEGQTPTNVPTVKPTDVSTEVVPTPTTEISGKVLAQADLKAEMADVYNSAQIPAKACSLKTMSDIFDQIYKYAVVTGNPYDVAIGLAQIQKEAEGLAAFTKSDKAANFVRDLEATALAKIDDFAKIRNLTPAQVKEVKGSWHVSATGLSSFGAEGCTISVGAK